MDDRYNMGKIFNNLTQLFFEAYDNGRFDLIQARMLIHMSVDAVHLSDEDESEAIKSSVGCRCGSCLKKMKVGDRLYSPYFTDMNWKYITDEVDGRVAYHSYCEDCLEQVFGEKAAKDIKDICDKDENSLVKYVWKGEEV
ncbi:MAG: hypothetical protein HFE90_04945 [Firmicutes bacterium]|nr:hypothetical protein [Bacillota bacterium]